ncbi:hypothetical protein ACFL6I_23990, partial [candidate division KSB1 bacterium]
MKRNIVGPALNLGGDLRCVIVNTLSFANGLPNLSWQVLASTLKNLGCEIGVLFSDSLNRKTCEFGIDIQNNTADAIFITVPFETELFQVPKFLLDANILHPIQGGQLFEIVNCSS